MLNLNTDALRLSPFAQATRRASAVNAARTITARWIAARTAKANALTTVSTLR